MTVARLVEFLRDSLELWRVEGTVEARGDAIVVRAGELELSIVATQLAPFRWLLRRSDQARERGCVSLLVVLSAMRAALGVDRGTPLRIA